MSEAASTLFRHIIDSFAEFGRDFVQKRRTAIAHNRVMRLIHLCHALLAERSETSGLTLARDAIAAYQALDSRERSHFFELLADEFSPAPGPLLDAARAYAAEPTGTKLVELQKLTESPRQGLFRRLNMVPGGTAALVEMRKALLSEDGASRARFVGIDSDLMYLFSSWFNRGFLVLRRIEWSTPAAVLEKLIRYEAVHAIQGWTDLRRRLERDRRCFAFFHPALPEEPLIFVEVALTQVVPRRVQELIDPKAPVGDKRRANCATFYSITNCQEGLRGVSFGNLLIKQVVADLRAELPGLKTFVTLSPVPGFRRWLDGAHEQLLQTAGGPALLERLRLLEEPRWADNDAACRELRALLVPLCAWYLTQAKAQGLPLDPVARFHIGNGARLDAVNWMADRSDNGLRRSAGIMVNYLYRLDHVEHETFMREYRVAAARRVHALARTAPLPLLEPEVRRENGSPDPIE